MTVELRQYNKYGSHWTGEKVRVPWHFVFKDTRATLSKHRGDWSSVAKNQQIFMRVLKVLLKNLKAQGISRIVLSEEKSCYTGSNVLLRRSQYPTRAAAYCSLG